MHKCRNLIVGVALGAFAILLTGAAQAQQTVRIGQAISGMGFLPIWAARAQGSFEAQGLTPAVSITGGDPAALAALDAGDVDLAAVGSEAVLRAAAKGQPFQIVYSLMSEVTLHLTVSNAFLEKTGVKPTDPLQKRLAALKGAVIGVSAIGGVEDSLSRWLALKGGLNPATDVKIVQVGGPPAHRMALENKAIDAFDLSPPEPYLAEQSKSGMAFINLSKDFPQLARIPYLILVAKKPVDPKTADLIVKTVKALQAASAETIAKPDAVGTAIVTKYFPKADPVAMVGALKDMDAGVAEGGKLDVANMQNLLTLSKEMNGEAGKELSAKATEGDLWTDAYVEKALAK
jgi:ABC-type nitrate/sulfonate/bicarbonate transport system substrate-binding protein